MNCIDMLECELGCEGVIVFSQLAVCPGCVCAYCYSVGSCEFGEEGDHAVVVGSGPCGSWFWPLWLLVLACEALGSGPWGSCPGLCGLRF